MNNKTRPKHLNLFKVRLPVAAIASILHRISGVLIFLATPMLLYILTTSLKNNRGFEVAGQYLDSIFIKLLLMLLIWSMLHHFFAGIRYLVMDLDIGLSKKSANLSGMLVMVLGVLLAVAIIMGVV